MWSSLRSVRIWLMVSLSLRGFRIFFFLMIRRPPRSTQSRSSAASDVYKRQPQFSACVGVEAVEAIVAAGDVQLSQALDAGRAVDLSLIHISEPTRPY